MNELSTEAKEVIGTLELIANHRISLSLLQQKKPETGIGEHINLCRIEDVTDRINELLGELSNNGYEVERNGNTTTVLKQGKKWLERMEWTEYAI